jgi:saccharopine dehydrogenase-like NADP-dependent oxidoreductase
MNIIVLGGYGNFGARISRALARTDGINLFIAGRDASKAGALAAECGATGVVIDIHDPQLAQVFSALGAGIVIHTAGPFQEQGYDVARAAAYAGAHYIDLADGRRFVCDFPAALDTAFRRSERLAITGASTVPALSSAVVDALTEGWSAVTDIDFCIAPAQSAPRGLATMEAVLNYCGAPIQVWQGGGWTTQYGWSAPQLVHYKRLTPRLGSLCDIPDLELFTTHYPGVQAVMFRAALEIGLSQRGLAMLASMRRAGIVKQPARFAGFLNRAADLLDPFGSALGGMVVRVKGRDAAGNASQAEWHIAADNDHGPEIPCMAAILLARALAAGRLTETGARTSASMLTLADFAPEFAKWAMVTDRGA